MNKFLIVLVVLFSALTAFGQNNFYDQNKIQKIEIYFSQVNWDYRMDTAKAGSGSYTLASYVKINGVKLDSVGVKYKGNSSYDSTYIKNPLHIELDTYKSQSYQGLKDIKLGNGYSDPSLIREVLAYGILQNYMDCPRANFAQVYINGKYLGLYSNDESINKTFLSSHFSSSNNTFIKCNPAVKPGPATKSNLKYISADSSQYFKFYEMKSATGWNNLVKLCDSVTNSPASIPSVVDVDRALWMLAFNNVLVNLDSYSGAFCQNYYLYKDGTSRYNPIVWDLNMAFGGFAFAGSGNSSLGALLLADMQQLSLTTHATDNYWPLIKNVLSNSMYKRMYAAHAKTIVNEYFDNNAYQTLATKLQSVADTAVKNDVNNFYTYAQFQNGMTENVSNGSLTIPGITNLMSSRVTYLKATPDFTATAPAIANVLPSNISPLLGTAVTISTQVTNTNKSAVYLGYRFSPTAKFVRVLMYDDGTHNDGTAGDNVYGASFDMQSLQAQYYIYAENDNAGIFSPVRAEHEFYSLIANISVNNPGEVVINEYLAGNKTDAEDESGQHEDWIELYNNTNKTVDLYGLYVSDDKKNLTKFAFPKNTQILAKDYLVLWADEDVSIPNYLHVNFKLSSSGEQLVISSVKGTIIDSLSFGTQVTDISEGRCPNGIGPIVVLPVTSLGTSNCKNNSVKEYDVPSFNLYPNPANNSTRIDFISRTNSHKVVICNFAGAIVYDKTISAASGTIDVSNLAEGVYLVQVDKVAYKKLMVIKP
jgi:hypothetical protein